MSGIVRRALLWVLIAVCLLPWLAFAWQIGTGGQDEPLAQRPTWAHLVVLTTARSDPASADEYTARRELDESSVFVAGTHSPSLSTAAAAASLWTGRWPIHHGVVGNRRALAGGTWTLASAGRGAGAKTAAFLGEPFVAATGIEGFDRVEADAGFDVRELSERARRWLEETPGRFALWLHLGPEAGGTDALIELAHEIDEVLASDGRLLDTVRVVTALGSTDATTDEARFVVPLWFSMPARLWAGRAGVGTINLVDLAEPLRNLLAWPAPAPGHPELQSRESVAAILRGASASPQHLLLADDRTHYLDPAGRLTVAGRAPRSLEDRAFETDPDDARELIGTRYGRFVERLATGATEARPAPPVSGFAGWSD